MERSVSTDSTEYCPYKIISTRHIDHVKETHKLY